MFVHNAKESLCKRQIVLTKRVSFLSKLDKHLHADEKVLWSDKPVKAPFLLQFHRSRVSTVRSESPFSGASLLVDGIIFLALGLVLLYLFISSGSGYAPIWVILLLVLGGLGLIVGPVIWQFMRYRNTEYMITNQRIITQTGAIGLDTRFVDLDKVQEVYVKVGVIDKLFGTGSVIAVTAGYVHVGMMRPSLAALQEPYKVQKLLQEAVQKARRKAPKKD